MMTVRGRRRTASILRKASLPGGGTIILDKYPNAVHGFQIHQFADASVNIVGDLNKNNSNATYVKSRL